MASTSHNDADYVRRRTRVYLLVIFAVDLAAYVSDVVAIMFDTAAQPPAVLGGYVVLRYLVTFMLVVGIALTHFGPPRRKLLGAVELAITLGLTTNYTLLGGAYLGPEAPANAPAAGLLGAVLLMTVRASLVPSSAARTAAVGLLSLGCWFAFGWEAIQALHPVAHEGFVFMGGAFVIATSVTSWVMYGLRREAREAQRLGQYELGRKLGEGGMGIVYEGTHVMLRRPTAVKLLPLEKAGEKAVARFEREVVHTSRLEHPNSVFIYDYGRTPEGQFYYAMEYLDGMTLRELLAAEGPLPVARAVHILRQASAALSEAHGLGLVHRDIKPANVMLCERAGEADVVKVLDFGLVKTFDNPAGNDAVTHANTIVGTPQYLAPEAIRAPDDVGAPADVYALGALAFFLLTGRHVFEASTVVEICSMHLSATPDSPSAHREDALPAELEALILRCLRKDPADRPQNGGDLVDALDALSIERWSPDDARRAQKKVARPKPSHGNAEAESQLTVDFRRR